MIERIPLVRRIAAERKAAQADAFRVERTARLAAWLLASVDILAPSEVVTLRPGDGWVVTVNPSCNLLQVTCRGQTVTDTYDLLDKLADPGACPVPVPDGCCPACGARIQPTAGGQPGDLGCTPEGPCAVADHALKGYMPSESTLAAEVQAAYCTAADRFAGMHEEDSGDLCFDTGVHCPACGAQLVAKRDPNTGSISVQCDGDGVCDAAAGAFEASDDNTREADSDILAAHEQARVVAAARFTAAGFPYELPFKAE